MTAPTTNWRSLTSWSERLKAVRGTADEQAGLMTIAAEAQHTHPKIWEAAFDAANPCDEGVYEDSMSDLEYLLAEMDADGPYEDLFPRYVEQSSFGMHHPDSPRWGGWL